MSSTYAQLKPLVLYGHSTGPNPWKVAIVLSELHIPYEHKMLQMGPEMKSEPYESLNPNGRVPALEDPNTGMKIFESGAIIDYIVEKYDADKLLTPSDEQTKWAARSWRDFQMSGQGPYFGQVGWFLRYHPEKLPSAVERYHSEVIRVIGVIDRHLAKQKIAYLTGQRVTYADLMWIPWNAYLSTLLPEGFEVEKSVPNFHAWNQKLLERENVQKVFKEQEAAKAAQH